MTYSKKQSAILSVLIIFILLAAIGCSGKDNKDQQGSIPLQPEIEPVISEETDLREETPAVVEKTAERIPEVFIEMFENHPLHRDGVLSPDNRYYAYEERSSIILVRLPAEEYPADKNLVPRVLFADGRRKESSFAEMEEDYARRLQQPLLTEEEIEEARNQLRSVYDWKNFYYLIFSQDSRYLAYLGFNNFGHDRTCTVYVLDLKENCKLHTLPLKENSEHAQINWLADGQTLEIYLPWAEEIEGGTLVLRRQWNIPFGQDKLTYYTTEDEKEVALALAQKAIAEYDQAEAERARVAEELASLNVQERVAALTPVELAAEYARYYTLHDEQKRFLQERGYSDEVIAEMDSFDFGQEEKGWLLSNDIIDGMRRIYPQLKDEDLSHWTYQEYEEYVRAQNEVINAPPTALKQEMVERGLPEDLTWYIAKEFYSWENMLAYTNEAIMAMYEAAWQTDAVFRKEEAYRLALREAYLKK